MKSGDLNLLETSGSVQACTGISLAFICSKDVIRCFMGIREEGIFVVLVRRRIYRILVYFLMTQYFCFQVSMLIEENDVTEIISKYTLTQSFCCY